MFLGSRPTGATVDPKLKQLMKQLGDAINESLAESEQIAEVIARIKSSGYDVFLVLEATIGFNKPEETPARKRPVVASRHQEPESRFTTQDLKFLRSLRISAEES